MFGGTTNNTSRAIWMLLLATSFWGVSFVLMKALGLCQQTLVPEANSWFLASLSVLTRFGSAAILLLLWQARSVRKITGLEVWQGVGLGVFGGLGILFQMDGVQHTSASTSAFLTQCYCVFIPMWVAIRNRSWPSAPLMASCLMVFTGVAVLSGFDWVQLELGRGEIESLIGSFMFTGQILWLERPRFAGNRSMPITLVQFAVIALVVLPVACATVSNSRDWLAAYSTWPTIAITAFLTLACTMVSYGLMNHWQPNVSATHAGLIYSSEPLFTSLFELFLPSMFAVLAAISYPNGMVTLQLMVGGGLITIANILVLRQAAKPAVPLDLTPEAAPATIVERAN